MQSENKNDSIQLSTRYQQYVFAKQHLRGTSRPEVFPFGQDDRVSDKESDTNKGRTQAEVSHTLRGSNVKADQTFINVVGTLDEGTWAKRNESTRRVYGTNGLAPTIPTGTGGGVMPKVSIPVLTPDRPKKRQNGRRMKEDGEPSFTLTAQDKHGVYDGAKIRRLTPTECERLQEFPDGWTEGVSDTQRYKQLGNAVTVNVIKDIMLKIIK